MSAEVLARSRDVAARSLRSNYRTVLEKRGERSLIVCGPHVYRHIHGRDFPYAAGGALLLGDFAPVKDTLEAFFLFQREDGLFPRALCPWPPYVMIALDTFGVRLPFRAPIKPYFVSEQGVVNSDCNALLAWTVERYARASGDLEFARERLSSLERAFRWYEPMMKDGVFEQPPFSDWQDSVGRRGRVFYTNLCLWKGLDAMDPLCRLLGREGEAVAWRARAEALRRAATDFFWDEALGMFRNSDELGGFDSASHALAAAWGFAPEKSDRVLETLTDRKYWRRTGPRATTPDYPRERKSKFALLGGNGDYHDAQAWSWITAMTGLALRRAGRKEAALAAVRPMAELIVRDGEVGECYEDDRQIARRLFKSESPFSWGAGMWYEAAAELLAG